MLAFRQASTSIYRAKERETNKERAREREIHSGNAYIFADVDGCCVCVCVCLCDAMLVSAGNSLWTRGHGLKTPDYSP